MPMIGKRSARLLLSCCVFLLVSGCGYSFPGQNATLPGGGKTIYVGDFRNHSRRVGLESEVRTAISDEIVRRGVFRLTDQRSTADVALDGSVDGLETRPVAFSTADEALQYETYVTLSASLRQPGTGKAVWAVRGLRGSDSYGAVSDTVITESAQFQEQSGLNAGDLDQLSDVQLSEAQREEAIIRVLENLSRTLYNSMVEDF